MNLLLLLLALVALGLFGLILYVALQSSAFSISRAMVMNAPPEKVFAQVNDFHNWEAWSPWAKLDPEAKNGFEGPESGKGAVFWWSGNKEVGEGRMTITDSEPYHLIRILLEFVRPMKATNITEFTFTPEGGQTVVVWTMSGTNNFIGRAVCLVMNMDKMVGAQFEKGLSTLKSIVEDAQSAPEVQSHG